MTLSGMMMRTVLAAAVLGSGSALRAQVAPPSSPPAQQSPATSSVHDVTPAEMGIASPPPADPARLAAARPVIDQVWPLGTYARIMRAVMDQVAESTLAGMYGKRADDLVASGKDAGDAAVSRALGEIMREEDPHFEERSRITMRVMGDEMAKLMTEFEPDIRAALATAYARRFTVEQLGALHGFFDTPTGRIYAAESMTLMMSPDMMSTMQAAMPRIVKAMPAIIAKVEEATKDLPAPKRGKRK